MDFSKRHLNFYLPGTPDKLVSTNLHAFLLLTTNAASVKFDDESLFIRGVYPGKEVLNELLLGEATPLYTNFDRHGTPFVYLPLRNGTPFTLHLLNASYLAFPVVVVVFFISPFVWNV